MQPGFEDFQSSILKPSIQIFIWIDGFFWLAAGMV